MLGFFLGKWSSRNNKPKSNLDKTQIRHISCNLNIWHWKNNTNTHKPKSASKKYSKEPHKQDQNKAKPPQNPQSLNDQGRKRSPLLKQGCWLQLEFFLLVFILKRSMVFVFLLVSTSIESYQNQDIHLCSAYKRISSYLHVCTPSLVSVFQKGSGCFVHLQNTTPIHDGNSSHSLGISEPVNTTTILIKERNSTGIL